MKVIFLDIDGVLNSEEFFVEMTQNCRYDSYIFIRNYISQYINFYQA